MALTKGNLDRTQLTETRAVLGAIGVIRILVLAIFPLLRTPRRNCQRGRSTGILHRLAQGYFVFFTDNVGNLNGFVVLHKYVLMPYRLGATVKSALWQDFAKARICGFSAKKILPSGEIHGDLSPCRGYVFLMENTAASVCGLSGLEQAPRQTGNFVPIDCRHGRPPNDLRITQGNPTQSRKADKSGSNGPFYLIPAVLNSPLATSRNIIWPASRNLGGRTFINQIQKCSHQDT